MLCESEVLAPAEPQRPAVRAFSVHFVPDEGVPHKLAVALVIWNLLHVTDPDVEAELARLEKAHKVDQGTDNGSVWIGKITVKRRHEIVGIGAHRERCI